MLYIWLITCRADIYDIEKDMWKRAASPNLPRSAGKLISLGNRVFVIGGEPGTKVVEEYQPSKDLWSTVDIQFNYGASYPGVTSVPAMIFDILYQNCIGVGYN